jgi:hypothetical protein
MQQGLEVGHRSLHVDIGLLDVEFAGAVLVDIPRSGGVVDVDVAQRGQLRAHP